MRILMNEPTLYERSSISAVTSFGFSSSRGMIVNFRRAGVVPVSSGVASVVTLMEKLG